MVDLAQGEAASILKWLPAHTTGLCIVQYIHLVTFTKFHKSNIYFTAIIGYFCLWSWLSTGDLFMIVEKNVIGPSISEECPKNFQFFFLNSFYLAI